MFGRKAALALLGESEGRVRSAKEDGAPSNSRPPKPDAEE
jgi:hypothetical protein